MKYLQKIAVLFLVMGGVLSFAGCSEDETTENGPSRLFRPVNVKLAALETSVTATWAGIDGAVSYHAELYVRETVEQGDTKYENKVLVARDENVTGTSWTVTGLEYDTQYYFRVKANQSDLNKNSHFTDYYNIKTPVETQVLRYELLDPQNGDIRFTWMEGYGLNRIELTAEDGTMTTYRINDADLACVVRGLSAGTYTAVAGNDERTFNTVNILIPVLYEVNPSDITFEGVTLHWSANSSLSKVKCVDVATSEAKEFTINGMAGQYTIPASELATFTTYTATLVYVDGGETNAVKFTTLDVKPEGMVTVSTYEELKAVLAEAANGAVIALNPGLYEVKEPDDAGMLVYATIDITKSVTLMAATAEKPHVIFKQFNLKNTAELDLVRIDGLEIEGYDENDPGTTASYLFDLNTGAVTVKRVEIENCYIHGISNSLVRADRSADASVLNVLINNNVMLNMNGKQAYVSTYNSTSGVKTESIVFTNNTIAGLSAKNANQRAFGYLASEGHSFVFENNTVYNCQNGTNGLIEARGTADGSWGTVSVKNNIFCSEPVDAEKKPNKAPNFGEGAAPAIEGNVVTFPWGSYNSNTGELKTDDWSQYGSAKLDPQFADPANGDFTLTNPDVIKLGVGDPRWRPAAE